MKAKFYLFLLFSLFVFNSKGQTPPSFPKDSAQWLNHSYGYITMDGAQYDTLYFYTMQGDTTITSINYKKLSLFKHYINYSNGTFGFLPESTIGALRYDSVLNEVYYYSYSSGIEKLAYKFDLATGDNFETNYTPYTFDSLITRAVDSTIIFTPYTGTQFTKNVRYLFHSNCGWPDSMHPPAILNNIGSVTGFLERYCTTEININELLSFSDLGNGDPHSFNRLSLLTTLGKEIGNSITFNVYPSPASDIINLSFKGGTYTVTSEIKIYNLIGEVVYEKVVNDPNTTIDVHSLKAGIYFIQLNTGNYIFVKKIIKQ